MIKEDEFMTPWVKENISRGLLAPYVGSCILAALLKVQREQPDTLELCLRSLWHILDRQLIIPVIDGSGKVDKSPSFETLAIYLVVNSYFKFRGNFQKGLDADLALFKKFGVGPEDKLRENIELLSASLSKDLLSIGQKHAEKEPTRAHH